MDLMTLADGSVTFTGTTVVPTADINGGSVDGVTLGRWCNKWYRNYSC